MCKMGHRARIHDYSDVEMNGTSSPLHTSTVGGSPSVSLLSDDTYWWASA